MYKFKCSISKPANYIYHMLSVSKVGYDNSYGGKYESIHDTTDLMTIKENEVDLTVVGGEHSGRLYGLLVAKPASLKNLEIVRLYFESVIHLFSRKDVDLTTSRYEHLSNNLLEDETTSLKDTLSFILNGLGLNEESHVIVKLSKILSGILKYMKI